jgi:hypothetical protein
MNEYALAEDAMVAAIARVAVAEENFILKIDDRGEGGGREGVLIL